MCGFVSSLTVKFPHNPPDIRTWEVMITAHERRRVARSAECSSQSQSEDHSSRPIGGGGGEQAWQPVSHVTSITRY